MTFQLWGILNSCDFCWNKLGPWTFLVSQGVSVLHVACCLMTRIDVGKSVFIMLQHNISVVSFFFSVQLRVVFYQGRCHQDSSFNLSLRQSVNIFLLICWNQFTLVQHFAFQFSFAHRNVYRRFLFDNFQLSQLPFCIQLTNMYSWGVFMSNH